MFFDSEMIFNFKEISITYAAVLFINMKKPL